MPFPGKGTLLIDLEGRIAFASSFFCDLVGVQIKESTGRSFFDFVFSEDVKEARTRFEACKGRQALSFLLRLNKSDGSVVWAEIQCGTLQPVHGEVYAVTATVTLASGPGEGRRTKHASKERK